MSDTIKMSYDDCPYHCTNGQIMNYDLKKLEPCPHCSGKRKELADKGVAEIESGEVLSLASVLGINNPYLKAKFVYGRFNYSNNNADW